MSVLHSEQDKIHGIADIDFRVADSTARLALTFQPEDVSKVVWQEDDDSLWFVTDDSPATMVGMGGLSGPGSSTDNAIPRFSGTGGDTVENTTALINDDGSVTVTKADATTNTIVEAAQFRHNSSGTVADGFGVEVEFYAEDDTSENQFIGALQFSWDDSATASQRSGVRLIGNYEGNQTELMVINGTWWTHVAGNARGGSAVDLQNGRSNASEVASGASSFLGGGAENTASAYYSAGMGGQNNLVSGRGAAFIAGEDALGDKRGQVVNAAGAFAARGDAQGTIQAILRRNVAAHTDTTWYSLWLDGTSELFTIPSDTAATVLVMVVGLTSGAPQHWSYAVWCLVKNDGGTLTVTTDGAGVKTIAESDAAYDMQVVADDTNDALDVQVRRNGGTDYDIRWVAKVIDVTVSY